MALDARTASRSSASGLSGSNEPKDYYCACAAGRCETLPASPGGNSRTTTTQSSNSELARLAAKLSRRQLYRVAVGF